MIAQLTGSVRSINSDRIILEVAGVGYLILLALKGDDRRWLDAAAAAWRCTPEAVFTTLAPVPAVVLLVSVAGAAGHVVGEGHGWASGSGSAQWGSQ